MAALVPGGPALECPRSASSPEQQQQPPPPQQHQQHQLLPSAHSPSLLPSRPGAFTFSSHPQPQSGLFFSPFIVQQPAFLIPSSSFLRLLHLVLSLRAAGLSSRDIPDLAHSPRHREKILHSLFGEFQSLLSSDTCRVRRLVCLHPPSSIRRLSSLFPTAALHCRRLPHSYSVFPRGSCNHHPGRDLASVSTMAALPSSGTNIASSPSPASAASAASTPAPQQQPTYTTAGTIYNPNSSQPLQPPARRGRATKWNVGNNQTDLCLFPKAVLAGLTMKAAANGRTTGMQQYAPLQQNSDRAVSPLSISEHGSMGIALVSQTPRLHAGNLSTQSHSLAHKENVIASEAANENSDNTTDSGGHDFAGHVSEQHGDGVDDDNTAPPAHLLSMSINGLKSLASYPNPCQKDAQKLLKPSVDLAATKASTTPVLGFPVTGIQKVPPQDEATGMRGVPGLNLLRPSPFDATGNIGSTQQGLFSLPTTRSPSPASGLERAMTPPSSSSASSTRSGPAPLTAGPPGQRQYRPFAYDSMAKGFQSAFETLEQPLEYADGNGNSNNASMGTEMFSNGPGTNIPRAYTLRESFNTASLIQTPPPSAERLEQDEQTGPKEKSLLLQLVETSEPDGPPVRINTGMSPYVDGPAWDQDINCGDCYTQSQSFYGNGYYSYVPGMCSHSASVWNDREEIIRRGWYAGSHLLGKGMNEIIAENNYRRRRCAFGAIGDGRPKPSSKKKEYPRISVEEANRITTPEHAEPLLRMMYGSLLQAVEEGKLSTEFYKWAEEQDRKYDGKVCVGKTASDAYTEVEAE